MITYRMVIIALFVVLLVDDAYAKTEPTEITIYISGQHKAMVAALLDAVDEGTPVTGIADFDSLSSTYGLMGIYRKGRRSSGFYGHRFRLTFPPGEEVAAIAGAYWNLPYVQSVEPDDLEKSREDTGSGKRITRKLISGALVGSVVGGTGAIAGLGLGLVIEGCPDDCREGACDLCGIGAALTALFGGTVGYLVGTTIGVSGFDLHDQFIASLGGSVVGLIGGIGLTSASPGVLWPSLLVGPVVGATLASELWRKPPQDSHNSRVSVGLGPAPNGGLSAVAQLRF